MDKSYVDTVRLLLEAAPEVFRADCFAMKGGTALNLFVEDMPRLSVDIDVVYVSREKSREVALAEIASELTPSNWPRARPTSMAISALEWPQPSCSFA
jgi:predicted nucleotidyltransferase component of viral defense system